MQLKHIPSGIVVKYQDTRSRALNRKVARRLLQDRLEELELGEVCLSFVREGRSTILQLIATMPKLKHLVLWEMGEKRGLRNSDMVSISMNHLKKGRKNTLTERTLLGRQAGDRLGRHYSGRDEVLSGLEELLAERLRYHQRTMFA